MVAEPTGPRSKADPKGQCSDGPGAAQVEELHNGRAGYPCDDGGLDGFLVTSFTPPIEVFKCQTHSERPGGRTFVHPVCLAILTPFTLSPCIQLVYGFRMIQTTLMGQFVLLHLDSSLRKFQTSCSSSWNPFLPHLLLFVVGCLFYIPCSLVFVCFYADQAVYARFAHIHNFQPKFYIGSTSSFVLDR